MRYAKKTYSDYWSTVSSTQRDEPSQDECESTIFVSAGFDEKHLNHRDNARYASVNG